MSTEVTEVINSQAIATPPTSRARIDKSVPIPYYYQLERLLRAQIEDGHWGPDQAIFSERQLCEQYGVSRTTVRQAIHRLVTDGLLYQIKGKGTFVARRRR